MKYSYQAENNNLNQTAQINKSVFSANDNLNFLDPQRDSHRVYQRRDNLFKVGDHFEGLYILRSGSAKSLIASRKGEEHITKFYYPGDMLGIDGFDGLLHNQSVRFLETSSVCLIKTSEIYNQMQCNTHFRDSLLQSMSHSLVNDNAMLMCLSTCSSEQKVARFLLDLSVKFSSRGLSGSEFTLSMTRIDIANYLGMAIETVSRIFASFQHRKLIAVQQRNLSILNFNGLNQCVSIDICSQAVKHPKTTKLAMN